MPKNVMVQDADGHFLGNTYPRRAKGLLKSGRAVLVDDRIIQLRDVSAQNATAPIPSGHAGEKEFNMKQELLFCAKAFDTKTKSTCQLLTAMDTDGDPLEFWELDGIHAPAEVTAHLKQLPQTEYLLRFAVVGVAEQEILRCTVTTDQDTVTYALERGQYPPQFSRRTEQDTLLRVYALPIQSGTDGLITITIAVKNGLVQIFPVQPDAVYAAMPPYDYNDWKQEQQEIAQAMQTEVNLSNAKLPKSALLQILANCGEHTAIHLENADIYNDME